MWHTHTSNTASLTLSYVQYYCVQLICVYFYNTDVHIYIPRFSVVRSLECTFEHFIFTLSVISYFYSIFFALFDCFFFLMFAALDFVLSTFCRDQANFPYLIISYLCERQMNIETHFKCLFRIFRKTFVNYFFHCFLVKQFPIKFYKVRIRCYLHPVLQ